MTLACVWPTLATAKPAPTPARALAQPALVARGTPSQSTLEADIVAANAREAKCQALLASKPKLSAKKRADLVAECKANGAGGGGDVGTMAITYDPNLDHCVDSTKTLCASPDVFHFISTTFEVASGNALTVATSDLQAIGGSTPDTVLYLVKCDDATCAAGNILAIDDDIGGWPVSYASSITVSAPASGFYAAHVVAYSAGKGGLCDLVVSQSGGVNVTLQDEPFSLWEIGPKEVRPVDVLLVAKNPGADSMVTPGYANYHDSKLLVVSNAANDCTSDCGRAQFQDDTTFGGSATTYMTRMTIGSAFGTPTEAKVMVGVYGSGTVGNGEYFRMHARLAHMRWYGTTSSADVDQDMVTAEVEAQLGTCDSATDTQGADLIVKGWGCEAARNWVNAKVNLFEGSAICGSSSDARCWRASDSDHDGIDDGDELFVLAVSCASAPAGPYREAGGCDRVKSAFSSCDAGEWCVVEPASGDMDSPFFGQDPTVYDVFVESDWMVSSNTDIDGSTDEHALSAAQQTELKELWGDEPAKCWDGASTGTCPGATDLRYRVNMHAFAGTSWPIVDDRIGREVIKGGEDAGADFARSHFSARANQTLRHYGALRYGFAMHQDGSGWSDGGKLFQWGNKLSSSNLARFPFSHELGHTFGLYHRHVDPPQGATAWCSGTPCSLCTLDGSNCTPALASHGCATAPTGVTAYVENPAPTLMSYQYVSGMLPMQSAPPSSSTAYLACVANDLRFSKGLLARRIDEKALDNSWQPNGGWEEWQLRHLAQSQFCYRSLNDCRAMTSAFALRNSVGSYFGPFCDVDGNGAATTCYFNWNGQTAQPTNTGTALGNTDITAGRWNFDLNVVSNQEVLEDEDEWARMISMGRQFLSRVVGKGMCLYANTFNGPQVDEDFCGWGESVTVEGGMSAGNVNYPIGGCAVAGDCAWAGATCTADPANCTQNSQCLSNSCVSGKCACSDDLACRSGQCVAGFCVTDWGGCSCQNDGECPDQGLGFDKCLDPGRCVTAREAEKVVPAASDGGQPWALFASAAFDGNSDRIKLHGGADSRLEALSGSYEDRFTLHFDFRFDGFQGSETAHVLWKSGAFQLTVVSGGNVEASVGGHTALVWSGLQRGRWYRAIWSASKDDQGHFLWLRRMDPLTGWYAASGTGSGGACVYQAWTSNLPSPGDVWMGHDGGSNAGVYFHGRLDNVALVNFVPTARPSGCTLQQ